MNCAAFIGSMFFFSTTLDQLRARASAASSELEVMVSSSLIIARWTAFRSKGDHNFSTLFSWADLPPLGGEEPWSFSAICFSICVLAILEAHSWNSPGACHDDCVLVVHFD